MECKFCKKCFKNKYTLKSHQKTAKYCLELRGNFKVGKYLCEYCNRDFTQKIHLHTHLKTCSMNTRQAHIFNKKLKEKEKIWEKKNITLKSLTKKFIEQISQLEKENEQLKMDRDEILNKYEKLAETIAKNPRTITNKNTFISNTVNLSIFDKTDDDINRIVNEKYNKDYLIAGQKGVARFTHSHVLNTEGGPIYEITDRSRGHGRYKKSNSEVVRDHGMKGLTTKVLPSIKQKAIKIVQSDPVYFTDEAITYGMNEVYSLNDDNSSFRNEMIKLTEKDNAPNLTFL